MSGSPSRPHLRDRPWTLTAIALGLLAVAFLVLLAAVGFDPAAYLLIAIVVGTGLVIWGTRIQGPRR